MDIGQPKVCSFEHSGRRIQSLEYFNNGDKNFRIFIEVIEYDEELQMKKSIIVLLSSIVISCLSGTVSANTTSSTENLNPTSINQASKNTLQLAHWDRRYHRSATWCERNPRRCWCKRNPGRCGYYRQYGHGYHHGYHGGRRYYNHRDHGYRHYRHQGHHGHHGGHHGHHR